ncbi:uncharacterized protein B0T15DRAFT_531743 [Chaetomium strumarium]|uniref:Transmembrane protein n=1 Tax=Chaetomium strumarium TaxID=1170767 RepID=A0AAJ0M184_9PEZI|nr:hypothetical protein B0T15DRAFT_531743 [Chaetomium strumarium]
MAPFPPLNDLLAAAAANLHPTRTLPHLLFQRQTTTTPGATVTVVTGGGSTTTTTGSDNTSNDPDDANDLSGGAIAGIVIGSIAGFLILVWIIRSCTNLGAPPNDPAEPGRPWYGSVRDEGYPPPPRPRGRSRHSRRESYRYGSRSHSHGGGGHGSRSRSRRVSVVREAVPVREVAPVVVRDDRYYYGGGSVREGRSRSRSRY